MVYSWKVLLVVIVIIAIISNQTIHVNAQTFLSPLKQLESGINIQDIKCKEGFVLVINESNEHPACVKLTTATRLLSNGWSTLEKFDTTHPVIQHNDVLIPQQNVTNHGINVTNQIATNDTFLSSKNNTVVDNICSAGTNQNSTYVTDSYI